MLLVNKWEHLSLMIISVLALTVNEVLITDVRDTWFMCVLVGNSSLCSVRNMRVNDNGILTFIVVHKAWTHDHVVHF